MLKGLDGTLAEETEKFLALLEPEALKRQLQFIEALFRSAFSEDVFGKYPTVLAVTHNALAHVHAASGEPIDQVTTVTFQLDMDDMRTQEPVKLRDLFVSMRRDLLAWVEGLYPADEPRMIQGLKGFEAVPVQLQPRLLLCNGPRLFLRREAYVFQANAWIDFINLPLRAK